MAPEDNGASRRLGAATGGLGAPRAFRGLALVFFLSFVNLIGVLVTAAALGGVEPWSRWQFIGMYGVVEAASGLANVLSPNVWRLPVAELQTSRRTEVKLAASVLLLPHWGGLARSAAGVLFIGLAASQEGIDPPTAALVPLVFALALSILAISALLARAGVARPDLDVLQFVVRWGPREKEAPAISISASVFQFLLAITTIPAAKLLQPTALYRPEIGPSVTAVLVAVTVSLALAALGYLVWSGRTVLSAPAEQQREAEEEANRRCTTNAERPIQGRSARPPRAGGR